MSHGLELLTRLPPITGAPPHLNGEGEEVVEPDHPHAALFPRYASRTR
jgi:hypothetical protein